MVGEYLSLASIKALQFYVVALDAWLFPFVTLNVSLGPRGTRVEDEVCFEMQKTSELRTLILTIKLKMYSCPSSPHDFPSRPWRSENNNTNKYICLIVRRKLFLLIKRKNTSVICPFLVLMFSHLCSLADEVTFSLGALPSVLTFLFRFDFCDRTAHRGHCTGSGDSQTGAKYIFVFIINLKFPCKFVMNKGDERDKVIRLLERERFVGWRLNNWWFEKTMTFFGPVFLLKKQNCSHVKQTYNSIHLLSDITQKRKPTPSKHFLIQHNRYTNTERRI